VSSNILQLFCLYHNAAIVAIEKSCTVYIVEDHYNGRIMPTVFSVMMMVHFKFLICGDGLRAFVLICKHWLSTIRIAIF